MAEAKIKHRQTLDRQLAKSALVGAIAGIIAAFLSVLCVCYISIYAIYKDLGTVAASIMVGSAAAIVGAFLLKRNFDNHSSKITSQE